MLQYMETAGQPTSDIRDCISELLTVLELQPVRDTLGKEGVLAAKSSLFDSVTGHRWLQEQQQLAAADAVAASQEQQNLTQQQQLVEGSSCGVGNRMEVSTQQSWCSILASLWRL